MTVPRIAAIVAVGWAAAAALVVAWIHAVTADDDDVEEQTEFERLTHPYPLPRVLP